MPASLADLAQRTLQRFGINLAPTTVAAEASMSLAEMAAAALRQAGGSPIAQATVTPQGGVLDVADLITPVLQRLGVIAADETGTPSDRNAASEKLRRVHSLAVGQNLASWTLTTIPDYAVEPYVIMASELLAPLFGKPTAFDAYAAAESRLATQALRRGAGQTIGEEKIRNVHAMLAGMGLAEYAISATPRSMAQAYIDAAAASLAPLYGGQADPNASARAEAAARRAALAREPGLVLATQAVTAAHRQLAAEGLAQWLFQELPAYAEEPYAAIASTILAPRVGLPIEMGIADAARRDLRRITMIRSTGEPVMREYF